MDPKHRIDPFQLHRGPIPPISDRRPSRVASQARERFALAQALAQDRLVFRFQPVACAPNPTFAAFHEMIAHLRLSDGRVVAVSGTDAIVGDTEIGREIDRLSLKRALRLLTENPRLRLSLNISTAAMGDAEWLGMLAGAHEAGSSACGRLILEIAEDAAVGDADQVNDFTGYIQDLGPALCLDNFGAGATGFAHFRSFRFDMVKIAPTFCRGIHASRDSQVLVECLQRVSMQFDMFSIADGVECLEDARWLCDAGIDCMQGSFYGRPGAQPEAPARPGHDGHDGRATG